MISVFTDQNEMPTADNLRKALGNTLPIWQELVEYAQLACPQTTGEWSYPSAKYGWSFRIKDKKRAIIYLLPRDKFFKVAMVFGEKAVDAVLKSEVSDMIKTELKTAKAYAEGRGIRIEIRDKSLVGDVKRLIDIKTH